MRKFLYLIIFWDAIFSNVVAPTHIYRDDVRLEEKEAKSFLALPFRRSRGRHRRSKGPNNPLENWIFSVPSTGLNEECSESFGCSYKEVANHGKGPQEVLDFMKDYKCKHNVKLPCPHGQACKATNADTSVITKLNVECSDIFCVKPSFLENGKFIVSKSTVGGTVDYSCNAGYVLKGATAATCEMDGEDGKWSADTPECQAVACQSPTLENGQVSVPKPTLLESVVRFQCDAGYVLDGKSSSTCVQNGPDYGDGRWTDPIPTCKAITCQPPSLINGRVTALQPALLGSAVSYQCENGYVMNGKGSSTCVEDGPGNVKGKWADPKPVCTAITCEQPSLLNGKVSVPKPAMFGSAVGYQCDAGYILEGKQGSTCVEDGLDNVKGKWADPVPVCTAITCETPSLLNGNISVSKPAPLGSAVRYRCNTGFVLEGKRDSTCVEDGPDNVKGKWADPSPVCTAIICEQPSLQNGNASFPWPAPLGSTVSYQCDIGYVREGKGISICVEDGPNNVKGKWGDPIPVCTAITCEEPSLLNGSVSVSTPATLGSTVSYRCNTGFVLEGKRDSTCVENGPGNVKGKWADLAPVCTAIICEQPSLPNGNAFLPRPALLGSAVSYYCDIGYVLEGKGSSTCVEDGQDNVKGKWADPAPVCTAIICEQLSLLNGSVSGPAPATLGSTVSYQCNTGFVLEGKRDSTCDEDGPDNVKGKWADPTPACIEIICEQQSLQNGHVSVPSLATLGSAVSYQCDNGYVLKGKGSSTCLKDGPDNVKGKWADPAPVCTAITCEQPSLLNGSVSALAPATLGSVVRYRCNTGFVLEGKRDSTCVEDGPDNVKGKWADPSPVCAAIICKQLSLLNGRVFVLTPAILGSAVRYRCTTGFVLEGKRDSTCVEDGPGNVKGKWADPAPVCTAIICEQPALLNGIVSVPTPATLGSAVRYQCNTGFVLEGKRDSTCDEDGPGNVKGEWADSAPVCTAIICEQPSLLNGSVSVLTPATLGSAVRYRCKTGFVLEGKRDSTCDEDGPGNVKGKWADPAPVCTAIICEQPSLLNGRVSVPAPAPLGSAVRYRCNTGFVLEGKRDSTCVEDGPGNVKGKWADPSPVCTATTCEQPSLLNGSVSVPAPAPLGSVVRYRCTTGFVLEGKRDSTCVENGPDNVKGKWTDPAPVCIAIICEQQPSLLNGIVSAPTPAPLGSTVSYQCNTGFVLEGKRDSTCVEDGPDNVKGKWTDMAPVCTAIICEQPSLLNGSVYVPARATLGSAVSYRCNTGFVLEGKRDSTCVEDGPDNVKGKWADPAPVCTAIICEQPSLLNGSVSVPTPSPLGSAVIYYCDIGYVLEGKGNSTCVENGPDNVKGKWEDPTPVCTAITCDFPLFLNGQVSAGELSTHGTTVNFRCNDGFILEGKNTSTCFHDDPDNIKGKWSEPVPHCKAIICEESSLANGNVSVLKPAPLRSAVSYYCDIGYVLEGKGRSICVEDGPGNVKGRWADPTPVCTAIICEQPSLLNGNVSVPTPAPLGSAVIYYCDIGYVLEGKRDSTCVEDGPANVKGKWTDASPVCTVISCDPPTVLNGQTSVTKPATYGTTVNYNCSEGFILEGKENSTCVEDGPGNVKGKWIDSLPKCRESSLVSPSSTIGCVKGDLEKRTNNTEATVDIGIGIGCAIVVLVLVTIGLVLVIKKNRRASSPHDALEDDTPTKTNVKDFQNPLYNMEEWDDGHTVQRDSTFKTFNPDVV